MITEIVNKVFGRVMGILSFYLFTFLPSMAQTYSLQQLKDSALHNNIAIRTANFDIDAARQQRKEAFTKYFPNVSGTGLWFNANRGMAQMDMNPSEMISPEMGATLAQAFPAEALAALANPISVSMMKNGTIGSLMAVQPVFAGGQIVNGNKLAKVGEEVSRLQLQLSENEVERQTEQYYWQLVSLQEKAKTVAAVDTLLADIEKDAEVAVRAGVALPNDLLQVQLRRNEVEGQRLKLENGIGIVRLLLAQFCGLNNSQFTINNSQLTIHNSQLAAQQDSIDNNYELCIMNCDLSSLPEYQLLGKQVEATRLQRQMAIGQQLPSVAVGAGYNYHNLLGSDRTFGMVFATVSVPISDWWGGSHAVKRRKIEQQKAEEQLADNAELLQIRMQNARNSVVEAQQQLSITRRSIQQAEENLRLNRNYYRAGTCTMGGLLEAQMLYQQALDRHADAYAELQNRLLEYRQSAGR